MLFLLVIQTMKTAADYFFGLIDSHIALNRLIKLYDWY
jgi:hypothetical protein